jgi:hypothetical protein
MLTICASPKPFKGHFDVIQRNAIRSWTQLSPAPQVILFGDSEGTTEIANEFCLQHVRHPESNEFGTPYLRSLIAEAEILARYDMLCYVNADIILTAGFEAALRQVRARMKSFLMVGRRMNIRIDESIHFDANWRARLNQEIAVRGALGDHTAIDLFVFPKGFYRAIPLLVIGRAWFDQWMIKAALEQRDPVVDASLLVPIVHQMHDYSHVEGGLNWAYGGVEAERNLEFCGGRHAYTLLDATHALAPDGKIRRVFLRRRIHRAREILWRVMVEKTHPLRKKLGLQRRVRMKSAAGATEAARQAGE